MFNFFLYRQGIFHSTLMMGSLFSAAITTTSTAAPQSDMLAENRSGQQQKLSATPEDDALMTVLSPPVKKGAGSKVSINAADMQQHGANDFGSIMRYQPLIGAVGSSSGSGSGKSGFDRAGYAGYNIRGLESNRVALSVDGIPQPDATGRGYGSRSGVNTVGIGRDYIDPYLYGRVDIEAGATATSRANTAMGGSVSFLPKSADDYLLQDKQSYFGYQSDYDSANRSWHNGITAAAGDGDVRGLIAYSRRDGQQTRNNSAVLDAYPANWHSDAVLTSAIWQPDEQHKLAATVDVYSKVNHSRYASWTDRFKEPLGEAHQQSNTRRWGISLKDEWMPDNDWIDNLNNKIYFQQTEAHDNTLTPQELPSTDFSRTYSDYNVKTWGYKAQLVKTEGRHAILAGVNAQLSDSERPFSQSPMQTVTKPQADSRTLTLGAFLQDSMQYDVAGHGLAVVPGIRVAHQETKPQNLANMATGTDVLTPDDAQKLYGKASSDSQLLPSLSFNYDLTPGLMTYLQYRRGAQFPNASQLYGSWNLGSNYIPGAQYALIGNTDLSTETSNNMEWGIKGQVNEAVTINASLFYNTYKNFIAYTRYGRVRHPDKFVNVPSNIATIYQAENRDNAYIRGGEISTKIHYAIWSDELNGLNSTFALGYSQGKSKSSYSGDKYVGLDSVAPMKAILAMGWDDPAQRYGAAVTATFVKGKKAETTNREAWLNNGSELTDSVSEYTRVPGYGVVDLSAWVKVSKQVKLNGGIYNLTDRKYWDYLSSRTLSGQTARNMNDRALAVMPGRNFQLGVNVEF